MFGFEDFWEGMDAGWELTSEDRPTVQRGWDTAYADFQQTASICFAKGIGPFCLGYNGCMRKLQNTLEEVIENPLELRIYQNIRIAEELLSFMKDLPESEETIAAIQIDLEINRLALKQYLRGE